MDDVLWLILVQRDVLSTNQPGVNLAALGAGNFLWAKTKWPPDILRSNKILQHMKIGVQVLGEDVKDNKALLFRATEKVEW